MQRTIVLVHTLATLSMLGVIWQVQCVHYPLFAWVGEQGFVEYEREHARRITWLVAPLMLVEGWTSLWLVWRRPAGVPWWPVALGLAALLLVWGITAAVQIPQHERLLAGWNAALHQALERDNWWRTVLWSVRASCALTILAYLLPSR